MFKISPTGSILKSHCKITCVSLIDFLRKAWQNQNIPYKSPLPSNTNTNQHTHTDTIIASYTQSNGNCINFSQENIRSSTEIHKNIMHISHDFHQLRSRRQQQNDVSRKMPKTTFFRAFLQKGGFNLPQRNEGQYPPRMSSPSRR